MTENLLQVFHNLLRVVKELLKHNIYGIFTLHCTNIHLYTTPSLVTSDIISIGCEASKAVKNRITS
jgi:hypothetical protein